MSTTSSKMPKSFFPARSGASSGAASAASVASNAVSGSGVSSSSSLGESSESVGFTTVKKLVVKRKEPEEASLPAASSAAAAGSEDEDEEEEERSSKKSRLVSTKTLDLMHALKWSEEKSSKSDAELVLTLSLRERTVQEQKESLTEFMKTVLPEYQSWKKRVLKPAPKKSTKKSSDQSEEDKIPLFVTRMTIGGIVYAVSEDVLDGEEGPRAYFEKKYVGHVKTDESGETYLELLE